MCRVFLVADHANEALCAILSLASISILLGCERLSSLITKHAVGIRVSRTSTLIRASSVARIALFRLTVISLAMVTIARLCDVHSVTNIVAILVTLFPRTHTVNIWNRSYFTVRSCPSIFTFALAINTGSIRLVAIESRN